VYRYKNLEKYEIENPFKTDENFDFKADEVFDSLKNIRNIEEVKIIFNINEKSINFSFEKKKLIYAYEIFLFYSIYTKEFYMNGKKIFLKEDDDEQIYELYLNLKDKENEFIIKIDNKLEFNYLYQLVIYKINSYYDDDYFLREQLDDIILN